MPFNYLSLLFGTCLLALAVGGCSDDVAETDAAGGGPGIAADDPPATIDPLLPPGTEAPAGAPAGSPADGPGAPTDAARFDGYGPARFGMGADAVRAAWAGELDGGPGEGVACFHLSPAEQPDEAHFALMFGDGDFVRYSVDNERMTAPGGGRVGMDEAQLEGLYGPLEDRGPHKYVDGGEYLRVADPAGGDAVLVFETDADDVVSEWRVGLPPHVDYVEGCS